MRTADVVKKLLDKPYKMGGRGDSYDCLSLFMDFHEAIGIDMPDEWRGWTWGNYAERWKNGEGREEYYEFLCEKSDLIQMNYVRERDWLIMRHEGDIYLALYVGNSNVLCIMAEHGVKVLPLWAIKHIIVEARRVKQ